MRHLQTGALESALDIETLIRLAAVQNALIAAHSLSHSVQGLDDPQPKLLALLVLGHGNVLDVADQAHIMDELALNNYGTGADNFFLFVADDEDVIGVVARRDEIVAGVELGKCGFADGGQDT
jgi:hypothetical protein